MTDNVESLVLEHLRAMRESLDKIVQDVGDIKLRISSVESRLTLVERGVGIIHEDIAFA
ncbi:MAG: hypothetical protein WC091_12005 [Sulfuricellaceae bacterium]